MWIDTAHKIVWTEYKCKYKNMAIEGEEETEVEEVTTSVSVCQSAAQSFFKSTEISLE